MRVLVTNDDGVTAPGIAALANSLAEAGAEVLVVAPAEDWSGSGTALGPLGGLEPLRCGRAAIDGGTAVAAYYLAAPPAMCVLVAMLGAFGPPPDIVASGVNAGPNAGRVIMHSGTVGAALTGANLGARGLAVSLNSARGVHWAMAAGFAARTLAWLQGAQAGTVLNINVPDRSSDTLRGVRVASLAPFGQLRTALRGTGDSLQVELALTDGQYALDSDVALLEEGFVTLTAIAGVQPAHPDLSDLLHVLDD